MTKRQLDVLAMMRDNHGTEAGELVYQAGQGYIGLRRVGGKTVNALIREMAVRGEQIDRGLERYTINQTGRELLKQHGR